MQFSRLAAITSNFYPRPPRGGRPIWKASCKPHSRFLSTPSARRATVRTVDGADGGVISIHALREEGDLCAGRCDLFRMISIHALREEGDPVTTPLHTPTTKFLSTPSARRATAKRATTCIPWQNFYPRPPRGGRLPGAFDDAPEFVHFYPRPPRGGRQYTGSMYKEFMLFLSTPSARRATVAADKVATVIRISIHALREEGDP